MNECDIRILDTRLRPDEGSDDIVEMKTLKVAES